MQIDNQIYVFPSAFVIFRKIEGIDHYLTENIMLTRDIREAKLFDAESAGVTSAALDILYGKGVFEAAIMRSVWRLQ